MLTHYFQNCEASFRFGGKVFNTRRSKSKSKMKTDVLDKLTYADNIAKTERRIQGAMG